MDLFERLEKEAKLSKFKPRPFFPYSRTTEGSGRKKKSITAIARRWVGTYLVQIERTEGNDRVVVYDELSGHDKKVAMVTGLDKFSSRVMYEKAIKILEEEERKGLTLGGGHVSG